jgi:uncharacterized protein YjgD (DUF1641 family)
MARPLSHTPTPPPVDPVGDQAADLMSALHETGLLRALTGAVRAYPDLLAALVQGLDGEKLKALATLGGLSDVLGAEGAAQAVRGVRSAVAAADHATNAPPPSLVALGRSLGDPDVRRGLGAIVAALGAFGREVAR